MTIGELAAIIAAVAFVVLVIFACISLVHVSQNLKETNETIKVLSKDLDSLSKQTEELLSSTNELLDDINKKAVELDPAVKAVADVGESVSNANTALNNMIIRHEERKNDFSLNLIKSAGKAIAFSAWTRMLSRRKARKAK